MRMCILEGDYEVHDRSRLTLVVATSGCRGTDPKNKTLDDLVGSMLVLRWSLTEDDRH